MEQAYQRRRASIEAYFDRTAPAAWTALTSDSPLSRIRETVRQGRERMRHVLIGWLPDDLTGVSVLDAGCGTGLLAMDLVGRGASVLGVDLSRTLIAVARERAGNSSALVDGRLRFRVGDMLDPGAGPFDYVVAMDSLIHYRAAEAVGALARLAVLARRAMVFTMVPASPLLRVKRLVGRLFPRSDRAPAVEPVAEAVVRRCLAGHPVLRHWSLDRTERVHRGFYTSQGYRLSR